MFFACWKDGESCGQIHETARAALEHCRTLPGYEACAGYSIAHADGSELTVAEINGALSPEARETMRGLARAFHSGAPDGDPH